MTPRLPVCRRRDAFELAQLLERVDAHVRVGADADADRRDGRRARPAGSRRRGSPRSSGRRRCARPASREQVELARRRRASRARSSCAAPRQPSRASSSIGRSAVLGEALLDLARLLVGVDVQRQLVLGGVAAELAQRRRPGRRARSGGRRRRGCPSPRSASSSRRYVGDRLLAEARRCRRAGSRRRGRRTRCRPRRPPRPRPAPRRARGSGTRRPPCSRSRAARGRPRRTRAGSRRRSATRRGRSSRRATPRSRRRPRARAAPAGTHGSGRRRSPGIGRRRAPHISCQAMASRTVSAPLAQLPNALTIARLCPDPGLRRADPDVRRRALVAGGDRLRRSPASPTRSTATWRAAGTSSRRSARSPTRSPTG